MSAQIRTAVLLPLLLALLGCGGHEEQSSDCTDPRALMGKSYRVLDGDTFKLKDPSGKVTIVRLQQIDAPERNQPWSNRSRQLLSDLIGVEALCVSGTQTDRYGRLLGQVYAGSTNVNTEMVRQGGAWAYRQYLEDQSLLSIEAEARSAKRGLWSLPPNEREAPWDFRHEEKMAKTTGAMPEELYQPEANEVVNPSTCNVVRTCKQMSNCAEAKQRLAQCGPDGIDGDRDGIPCEKLCRL